ncbi:MAG: tetratricopeptide repeat protein [Fimbriimonadales bacterium]
MERELRPVVREAHDAIRRKGFAGARPILAQLCEQEPDVDELHALHALVLLWTGRPDEAQGIIDKRLAIRPSASIYGVASEVHRLAANVELASELVQRGRTLDPDDYLVLRSRADQAATVKDLQTAREINARSLELYPQDPDTFGSQATYCQIEGQLDRMQSLLDTAPGWFLGTAQYYAARGRLAFSRHDLSVMEEEFKKAIELCPEGGSYWGYLATAQHHQGKYAEAERSAQAALELNPRNPLALKAMAKVAGTKGDRAGKAAFEEQAAKAIPALQSTGLGLRAANLRRQGNLEGALKLYRQQSEEGNPIMAASARRIVLMLLVQAKRWDEARKQLDAIEALGEVDEATRSFRSQIRYREGDQEGAVADIEILLAEKMPVSSVFPAAMQIFLDSRLSDQADRLFERIMRDLPGNPGHLAETVMALANAGRKQQARALIAAAQSVFPQNDTLKVIEVGFAAEDKDFRRMKFLIQQLPPASRPRIRLSALLTSPRFWRALGRTLFRRKRQ